MATMAEVAALAGVSTSTVSHVLNRTRAVDPRTRARVEQAIRATGYRPNHVARSLATSSSRTIGLAMSMLGRDNYFAEFAHSIETSARQAGYTLTYADTHDEAGTEQLVLTQFLSQRIDGMIWASSGSPADAVGPAVATVLVDRLRDEPHDQIGPENLEAMATLTAHLADHGHRRIALVAGLDGWSTTAERIAGYRRVVAERGLDADPALVVHGDSQTEPARRASHALFAADDPPTALISANNAMTFGVLRALRELGLSAPHDVALACYDDFDWADLVTPGPTAMRQQIDRMGRRSVELLLARIKDPYRPYVTERVAPEFRVRETCGCPPATVPHPQRIPMGRPARTLAVS
ncbi:LacI family DNA-binding transcriptional regulator [uncultured Friedmanniella sp.]|uniref:LacI family DNA-binding transcriptional regulator n=1 Tax=uncultured Friedmanniella sp. TaxID=335381 RepID=UPI0035CC92F7